jgi:serine protease Do
MVLGLLVSWGSPASPLACARQDEPDKVHVRVAKKVAPATVYVEGPRHRGSGVIIDKSGIILTSPAACGAYSDRVTVLTKGAKIYTGKVMGRVNEKELVLVKIEAKDLPHVELGDSDQVKIGQVSYVFGDCFDSMRNDDQPAMSMGVISGVYTLSKKQPGTYYTGTVIETSAAVNPNQDGGPLVDKEGKLIGIVTLNYDESKFTGVAVPINVLRADIDKIRKDYESGVVAKPPAPPDPAGRALGEAWLGAEVKAVDQGLEVLRVARRSPAAKAGVQKGDVLTKLEATTLLTSAALEKVLGKMSPGDPVLLTLVRDGEARELRIVLAKKPVY